MKRRSGVAIAAQRRNAGPMRHRLQPRGGARNEQSDLLQEYTHCSCGVEAGVHPRCGQVCCGGESCCDYGEY